MLPKEVFDEYGKKRLRDLLEKGEKDLVIYAGFTDAFGDAGIIACNKCGTPCFVRPWLLEAIIEHNWKVICVCCADSKDFMGQVAMDFSKIETETEIKTENKNKFESELALQIKKTCTRISAWNGPVTQTNYSAWRTPDGKYEVGIHDLDNEIFAIRVVATDEFIHNPRDIERVLRLCLHES